MRISCLENSDYTIYSSTEVTLSPYVALRLFNTSSFITAYIYSYGSLTYIQSRKLKLFLYIINCCISFIYEFTPVFYWGSCHSIFSFMCMFCRTLFVIYWGSCYSIFSFMCMFCRTLSFCLLVIVWSVVSFFDLRFLITLWYFRTLHMPFFK